MPTKEENGKENGVSDIDEEEDEDQQEGEEKEKRETTNQVF
jgi:hypothetical protein